MKKLVLFAAVVVAISLSACKKTAPAQEPVQEEVITVVDPATEDGVESVVDSDAVVVEETTVQ